MIEGLAGVTVLAAVVAPDISALLSSRRIVFDVWSLPWARIVRDDRPWVVLEWVPDAQRSRVVAGEGYVDENGNVVRDGHQARVITVAECHVRAVLTRPPAKGMNWSCRWVKPGSGGEVGSSLGPDRPGLRTGFRYGGRGFYIVRIDDAASGEEQFAEVYALPPGWEGSAKSAAEAMTPDPDQLDPAGAAEHLVRLLGWAAGDNPLLAAAAWRTLAEARQLDAAVVGGTLESARGFRQAAVARALLHCAGRTGAGGGAPLAALERVVRAARDAEAVLGVAAAADSVRSERSTGAAANAAERIIRLIAARPEMFAGDSEPARRLRELMPADATARP